MIKVKREFSGYYRVSDSAAPTRTVLVEHVTRAEGFDFDGWMARAEWTNNLFSDPCDTKRDAVAIATEMLAS